MTADSKRRSPTAEDLALYYKVPSDFPKPEYRGALSGVQAKLQLVAWNGKYYIPGHTPPELYSRWDVCEDLAIQFAKTSAESKLGKRAHMSEVEILSQYLPRLIAKRWTSETEARWVIRRAAEILGWPCPPDALNDSASGLSTT